jgi:DNA-binding response OmpR family regulator
MPKILVIEDEPALREDIAELLTLEGYDVISAKDGVDGINAAIQFQPDLIVCDIMMPRLDGYRVLLDVRANSITQFTPFIFLTAKSAQDEMRQGMELGADDYVTKPFTHVDLRRAVEMRLEKHTALQQEQQEQTDMFRSALAYERQQRLFKEKLVAMFSKGFPLPLENILTSNNLLRDYSGEMDDTARQAHFNRIEASAHQLQRSLDDIFLVAQMESGSLQVKPERLNVGLLIEQIVDDFRAIYGEAYRLVWECRSTDVIMADARLLHQITANLIASAIQHSPRSGTVRISLDHQIGRFVLIVTEESGSPQPERGGIVRQIVTGETESEDVGLEIVTRMVELYGGTLSAQRQPGVGSTVAVTFPPL